MINHLFNSKIKMVAMALLLVSCGITISGNDAKRTYKTLVKSKSWKVKKLTISKVDMSQTSLNPPVVWDTVFYDYGRFEFEKHKFDDFSSKFFFNNGKSIKISHAISGKLDNEKLFITFYHNLNGKAYRPNHGSGYLNKKKGKFLTIKGKPYFWDLREGGHYFFAEFIKEPDYYKCDWELESND